MSIAEPFSPQEVFLGKDAGEKIVPNVLISSQRYIQGDGVIAHLGRYLSIIQSIRPAILISEGGMRRIGDKILESLRKAKIEPVVVTFMGESSYEEIDRAVALLRTEEGPVDSLIAIGGGKCLDTGKSIAYRLSIPVVICPTIISNDAPCSAVSVIYAPDGVFKEIELFPSNPSMVVVDTRIIAQAPLRYLVSGMGDAMATWYEARTCFGNPKARNNVDCRPTIAARTIAEQCEKTLYEYGTGAIDGVKNSQVNGDLERIVEANTLLSGMGFESGGLAAAHSVAGGLTVIPALHKNYLHGEMVAMGLLTQLMLEDQIEDAKEVASFFSEVGLPVHLGHLSLDSQSDIKDLERAMEASMKNPFIGNEPFEVNPKNLLDSILKANDLGKEIASYEGDSAYRSIHNLKK